MQTKPLSQILQCAPSLLPNRLNSSDCLSEALFELPPSIPVLCTVLPPHATRLEKVFQIILPPRCRPPPPAFSPMWDLVQHSGCPPPITPSRDKRRKKEA